MVAMDMQVNNGVLHRNEETAHRYNDPDLRQYGNGIVITVITMIPLVPAEVVGIASNTDLSITQDLLCNR